MLAIEAKWSSVYCIDNVLLGFLSRNSTLVYQWYPPRVYHSICLNLSRNIVVTFITSFISFLLIFRRRVLLLHSVYLYCFYWMIALVIVHVVQLFTLFTLVLVCIILFLCISGLNFFVLVYLVMIYLFR